MYCTYSVHIIYVVYMYARYFTVIYSFVQWCRVREVLSPPEAMAHACHDFQNTFFSCARDCDCNFFTDLLHQDHARLTNAEYGLPEVEELLPTHVCCLPFAISDIMSEIM